MYQIVTFLVAAAISAGVLLSFKGRDKAQLNTLLKCLTVLFCAVGFFRFLLSDAFIKVINSEWHSGVRTDLLQSVLRWGYYINYSVLPMAVFYKSRLFRNIASYICLPFSILSTVFFNDFMAYFLDPKGSGIHTAEWFRYAFFVFELALAIAIPIILQIGQTHVFDIKSITEWKNFLIAAPLVCLVAIPVYLPQSILGYKNLPPKYFDTFHLGWIVVLFVITIALYYAFRFRSYQDRLMLCMFLTILLFFHYDSLYLMGITIKRLPFQLCNIASYFYIIAMVFKLKKMFHFCFLANIVGTIIAIMAPDFPVGVTSFWSMHYVFEHSLVLIVPAMVMGLRIFPRVNLKSIKYFLIGFTIYFLFAFVMGTVLNGYSDITGERVNYFFMFDLEMALDYAPFMKFALDHHYVFGRFEFYPIIVVTIYLAFVALSLLFYMLVRYCYKLEDDHLELRSSGIDLYEKITGKTSRRPKHFID